MRDLRHNRERLIDTMDEIFAEEFIADGSETERVLAALEAAGYAWYRPDELDRDLKWQCQGRVWPAGKPIDPAEHKAEEGHRYCKWVRLVPVESGPA